MNKKSNNKKKSFNIIAIAAASIAMLAAAFHAYGAEGEAANSSAVRGAILPHHNIVGEYMDQFYEEIADPTIDRVILISTNHFDTAYHYIQSTKNIDDSTNIDTNLLQKLEEANALGVTKTSLRGEHGLTVHTPLIKKHFPDAKVLPIAIKWKTPQENLDKLVAALTSESLKNTLIVASIDFSHYISEETALENDNRTIAWLKEWEAGSANPSNLDTFWALEESTHFDTPKSTALDSPEAFYVITNIYKQPQKVEIWKRTSSASLFNIESPMQNTSHLFVKIVP